MSNAIESVVVFLFQLWAAIVVTSFGLLLGSLLFFIPGAIKLIAAWLSTF